MIRFLYYLIQRFHIRNCIKERRKEETDLRTQLQKNPECDQVVFERYIHICMRNRALGVWDD